MNAAEKRIGRNMQNEDLIPCTFEDISGRLEEKNDNLEMHKISTIINKLENIPYCNIRQMSSGRIKIKSEDYSCTINRLINWVCDDALEHFREIAVADYLRTYKLNFGDVETTYQITFERWS